jgi:ABC-2 type transport system permease protein
MPTGLRWFAEYQPFTPIIETLRGLLLGTAIGSSASIAVQPAIPHADSAARAG